MIWLILLLGLALRLINLNQSLWLDEAINILATRDNSLWMMITKYSLADFHPPGYFLIIWVTTHLFGYSEIAVRVPSLIFGLISIWLTYKIGKEVIHEKVGLISALFLSINGLHIYYSQEARMYSYATMAVLLNILLFNRLISDKRKANLWYSISTIIVLSSDYVSYLIFPAELIYLILWNRRKIKSWILWNLPAGVVFLIWLPLLLKQLSIGFQTARDLTAWNEVVGGFSFKSFGLTFVKFMIGRISFDNKIWYYLGLVPILGSGLIFLGNSIKRFSHLKLIFVWFFIPLILAWFISLKISIFSYFRLLYLLPAFLILISSGLDSFKNGYTKNIALVLTCLVFLSSAGIYLFDRNQQREDWKNLVTELSQKNDGKILLESNGLFSPFEYYAGHSLNASGGLIKIPAKNQDDVINIQNLNTNKIYLLQYLVEVFDPDRLLAQRIVSSGFKLTNTLDYHGVGFVYEYRK